MNSIVSVMMLASVLVPTKTWFSPNEPINVKVTAPAEVSLVVTDFTNRALETRRAEPFSGERVVDLKALLPEGLAGGCYLIYAVPRDAARKDFVGTPLVVTVREDRRQGAPPGPMVVKVEPMSYVVMTTDKGPATIAFYYDVAPHTTANFLSLAQGGFYDGLTFHRIVPDFVVQGGDPRGDGTGGPGYMVHAEFNNRPHLEGVLSMARGGDPNEAGGAFPRCEFANSAGSQFFIALNYENAKQLDRRYTAFARVVEGLDAIKAIATVPLADQAAGRPKEPPKIQKVEVRPVTAQDNPYKVIFEQVQGPSLLPSTGPAVR